MYTHIHIHWYKFMHTSCTRTHTLLHMYTFMHTFMPACEQPLLRGCPGMVDRVQNLLGCQREEFWTVPSGRSCQSCLWIGGPEGHWGSQRLSDPWFPWKLHLSANMPATLTGDGGDVLGPLSLGNFHDLLQEKVGGSSQCP